MFHFGLHFSCAYMIAGDTCYSKTLLRQKGVQTHIFLSCIPCPCFICLQKFADDINLNAILAETLKYHKNVFKVKQFFQEKNCFEGLNSRLHFNSRMLGLDKYFLAIDYKLNQNFLLNN